MWYSIYDTSTGEYKGGSSLLKNIPDPLPEGMAMRTDDERMDQGNDWNTSTLQWDPKPPVRRIPIASLMQKFTDDELFAFGTSVTEKTTKIRNVLKAWQDAQKKIDLDSARTSTMMQFLVDDAIITSERRDAILA